RLYVPRDVQSQTGASERELAAAPAGPLTMPWSEAIARCVAVTREQFVAGRAVCDGVRGRLKYELRLTWLGGHRILERVERARRGAGRRFRSGATSWRARSTAARRRRRRGRACNRTSRRSICRGRRSRT